MNRLRVALVSRDPAVRLQAARALDGAPVHWIVDLHEEAPAEADVVLFGPDLRGPDEAFDPNDPLASVSEVEEASVRGGRVIAVTGSNGGVGTTTVAVHLAAALARRARTCLIDCDPHRGAARRMGLPDDAAVYSPDAPGAVHPAPGGFRVVVPEIDGASATIDALGADFEFVLLDVPAEGLRDAWAGAAAGVMVMRPAPDAAVRARAFLETQDRVAWVALANRIGPGGQCGPGGLARRLGRRISLELPCTPDLRDAEEEHRLHLTAWSRWTRRIQLLARSLARSSA